MKNYKIKNWFILLLVIIGYSTLIGQFEMGKPDIPGKCFAKCLIPSKYEYDNYYEYFLRYTGDDRRQKGVKGVSVITKDGEYRWVKKKADRNCLSDDPEDCLVWCIVESKEVRDAYFKVIDTMLVKDFKLDSILISEISEVINSAITEWKEIICEADVTLELIQEIQNALIVQGFDTEDEFEEGVLGSATKAALSQYQQVNKLPIGHLNVDTLEALEVIQNED